jgi:DNA replication protein DnaC
MASTERASTRLSTLSGGPSARPRPIPSRLARSYRSAAIENLVAAQITLRNNRRLQAAMRSSRLPAVKTLADFDFSFQPSIKREQIESLHDLGFVGRKENVVFLGPPGVGKTHLAISLAIAAA